MTELVLQTTISNACVAALIAVFATVAQRRLRSSSTAHLLWLLALAKLVTPPIVSVPVIPVASETTEAAEPTVSSVPLVLDRPEPGHEALAVLEPPAALGPDVTASLPEEVVATEFSWLEFGGGVWAFGSLVLLAWSVTRVLRFHRLLSRASTEADPTTTRLVARVAKSLGLRRAPAVQTVDAALTPFIWSLGRRTRLVLPRGLSGELQSDALELVIAHELAHVKRRDHLVRWLEWLAVVLLWWNPILWWARRGLRTTEESSCDELVLESLQPAPREYASSLLRVAEFLSKPALRPPALASSMHQGGNLERRLRMIVTTPGRRASRWMQAAVLAFGAFVLPTSLAYAQDYNAVERRLGEAVAEGEITLDQAKVMMDALRRSAGDRQRQNPRDRRERREEHERDESEFLVARIAEALEDADIERERIRPLIGIIRRIAFNIREGDLSILRDERLRETFEEMELDEEQVEFVFDLSRRVAATDVGIDRDELRERNEGMLLRRIAAALSEAGVAENKLRKVLGMIQRVAGAMREEGNSFEMDEDGIEYLRAQGLSGDQIRLALGLAERLADSEEGRNDERRDEEEGEDRRMRRIAVALSEGGIDREQIREAIEMVQRLAGAMREQGNEFEMDEGALAYMRERGFSGEQIRLILGLAERIADSRESRNDEVGENRREALVRRGIEALAEVEIEGERVRPVLGMIERIAGAMREEGDEFEVDEGIRRFFGEMELNEKQVERVLGLARALASMEGEERDERGNRERREGERRERRANSEGNRRREGAERRREAERNERLGNNNGR